MSRGLETWHTSLDGLLVQVFGVPSLRTEKVPPQQPSVAGRDDYGNAATMDQVMKPRRQNQVADGLMTQRGPQEIR